MSDDDVKCTFGAALRSRGIPWGQEDLDGVRAMRDARVRSAAAGYCIGIACCARIGR